MIVCIVFCMSINLYYLAYFLVGFSKNDYFERSITMMI